MSSIVFELMIDDACIFDGSYAQAIGVDIVDYHYHLRLRKFGVPTAKR